MHYRNLVEFLGGIQRTLISSSRVSRLTFHQPVSLADSLPYRSFFKRVCQGCACQFRNSATEIGSTRSWPAKWPVCDKLKITGVGNSCSRGHFFAHFHFF